MALSVARDTIICPGCKSRRIVTSRQARSSRQRGGILCTSCRGGSATRPVSESHFRFWLGHYGVTAPKGVPVRDFITAGGAPAELVELAKQCYPAD